MKPEDFLVIDLETRSTVDLISAGAWNYAMHPDTDYICIGWGLDGEYGVVTDAEKLPKKVRDYIIKGDGLVVAHNAAFDRLIWQNVVEEYHPLLHIPTKRWYCTVAQMRVNALPGKLEEAGWAVFGKSGKDPRGAELIRLLSIPRDDGTFNMDPMLIKDMCEYCENDVRATVDIMANTRFMSAQEFTDYHVNEAINDRGVGVDLYLAELAMKYAGQETAELAERLNALTEGEITKHTQVQRIKAYVEPHLDLLGKQLTTVHKKGEKKFSLDKNIRARLLTAVQEGLSELPADVVEVIEILDEGNKSSVSKFGKMLTMADEEERIHGAFHYAGAVQTLRFASRGLQLHNFKRDCLSVDNTELLISIMEDGDELEDCMSTLARALRPAIVPAIDHLLVVGDWSQIEARALPWLANDPEADKRLDLFRAGDADPKAPDVYEKTCADLNLKDRQIGKVTELSMGYGGASGAFNAMAVNYGVVLPEAQVKAIVQGWRAANAWAEDFWNALERAARRAIGQPYKPQYAGRVSYCFYPELIGGTLTCTLPGGTMLQYPRAKLEEDEHGRSVITALKANWKPAAGESEWPRVNLWRGLLAENATQAFCAALLRNALWAAQDEELRVVAHVHDEIVAESHYTQANEDRELLKEIMEEVPSWAEGLPLKAKPETMERYGK